MVTMTDDDGRGGEREAWEQQKKEKKKGDLFSN
jgi:hypothetical protein